MTHQPNQQKDGHSPLDQAQQGTSQSVESIEYGKVESQIQQVAGQGPGDHHKEKDDKEQQGIGDSLRQCGSGFSGCCRRHRPEVKPKIAFEVGEVVRIKDGAFENFEGAIQEIDNERGKLKLMVSIFGRSTPVELEFWQVERTV